mmetsp:Transcript_80725/g.231907  ORF Transcript_80725/g.231907 Transcript_80725/m.231907 type:complete len:264 (-) Transcript_80725:50-841(-)
MYHRRGGPRSRLQSPTTSLRTPAMAATARHRKKTRRSACCSSSCCLRRRRSPRAHRTRTRKSCLTPPRSGTQWMTRPERSASRSSWSTWAATAKRRTRRRARRRRRTSRRRARRRRRAARRRIVARRKSTAKEPAEAQAGSANTGGPRLVEAALQPTVGARRLRASAAVAAPAASPEQPASLAPLPLHGPALPTRWVASAIGDLFEGLHMIPALQKPPFAETTRCGRAARDLAVVVLCNSEALSSPIRDSVRLRAGSRTHAGA